MMHDAKQINSSIYYNEQIRGEQYTRDLLFSYQISGKLITEENGQLQEFRPGSFRLVRNNRLIKFWKVPEEGKVYQSLSIVFRSEMLRAFADDHGYRPRYQSQGPAVIRLPKLPLYKSLVASLLAFTAMNEVEHSDLILMKIKETLLILLKEQNELQQYLFDFSQPVKTDLFRFMHENFHHNLPLSRFAYLSGRSLAGYKRDFKDIFHISPGRWLLERRLDEAARMIGQRDRRPSEIYLALGFEDIAHFSRAFKKKFGFPPSKMRIQKKLNPD